ncbi:MAG: hypothetical protein ACREXR_10110 [Gammaproteobacteria bacterium]
MELFLILQNEQAWNALEKTCGERIEALFRKHRAAIRARPTSDREEYNKVREVAKDPEALEFRPPTDIMVTVDRAPEAGFRNYRGHLYVDEAGLLPAKLNIWEHAVITEEMARRDVIGWLRNFERKPLAFALPYEYGGQKKPMYPDFLVVREEAGHPVVDILEPHADQFTDNYAKAKGLAQFAAKHKASFGRIELIRVEGKNIKRLDLADDGIRKKVLSVDSNEALDLVFSTL